MIVTVIYTLTLTVWIISMLLVWRFRKVSSEIADVRYPTVDDEQLPPLSVIVLARNQEHELKRNLPLILNQIYPKFEVIVVDINSTDETKKLLEKMEEDHIMLRHSSTPATSRDISKQRLAITLGVRASVNDWFVLTEANCCPISHLWLQRIGECIAGHRSAKMVLGYTRYKNANDYPSRRLSFYSLWRQIQSCRIMLKGNGAYYAEATNLAYNKKLFLSHQGFASGSNLLEGATEIMVNQNSTFHNTALCMKTEAFMEQEMPRSANYWRNKRLFFQETQRHFSHRWKFMLHNTALMTTHSFMALLMLASLGISLLNAEYIISAAVLLLWILHFVTQGIITNTIAKRMNDKKISPFTTAWFMHLMPLWSISIFVRHLLADKNQFRKKYI